MERDYDDLWRLVDLAGNRMLMDVTSDSGDDLSVEYEVDALHRLRRMENLSVLNNAVTISTPLEIDYFGYRRQRKK